MGAAAGPSSPASIRIKPFFQWKSNNTANQQQVKNVVLPAALKSFDKYFQLKDPETANLLVSSYWLNSLCFSMESVTKDIVDGRAPQHPVYLPCVRLPPRRLLAGRLLSAAAPAPPSQATARATRPTTTCEGRRRAPTSAGDACLSGPAMRRAAGL